MLRVFLIVCVGLGLLGCGPTLKYNFGPAPVLPGVTVNVALHEGSFYIDGRRYPNGIDAGNAALDKSPAVILLWSCPGADRDQRGQFPSMQLGSYLRGRFRGSLKSGQSLAGQNGCPGQPQPAPRMGTSDTSSAIALIMLEGGSYRVGDRVFEKLNDAANHISTSKPSELVVVLCSLTRFEEFEREILPNFQQRGLRRPVLIPGSAANCPKVR